MCLLITFFMVVAPTERNTRVALYAVVSIMLLPNFRIELTPPRTVLLGLDVPVIAIRMAVSFVNVAVFLANARPDAERSADANHFFDI
jgi:hypothetical protein